MYTRQSICILVDKVLFTGDTLFVDGCGRTDLEGGDAGKLYDSLYNRILKLDDDILVYPGHDYGGKPYSSIGEERRSNFVLQCRSREEFIDLLGVP